MKRAFNNILSNSIFYAKNIYYCKKEGKGTLIKFEDDGPVFKK